MPSTSPTAAPPARLRPWGAAFLATVVAVGVMLPSAAQAAPEAPLLLGPDSIVSGAPEISWEPDPNAVSYEVQVDDDPSFATPEFKLTTVNTLAVVDRSLAAGQQHLRVRARDNSGRWSDWSTGGFVLSTTTGPRLVSPADHDPTWQGTGNRPGFLPQPAEPPVLRWDPVPGATSYTVEIASEPEFITPAKATTTATAYAVPNLQTPDVPHYWHVQATVGDRVYSAWSSTRSYVLGALDRPTLVSPLDDERVQEVVLEWNPVDGATHYQLEVSTDEDFQSFTHRNERVFSTRYSPATTLGNGDYYWRVRAVDADSNTSPWSHAIPKVIGTDASGNPLMSAVELSEAAEFTRDWREKPQLVHPRDSSNVGDDFYYQWEPVQLASSYQLYVSTDPTFTGVRPCATTHATTFTPALNTCMPLSEGIRHYWYVIAVDAPSNVTSIRSDVWSFIYTDATAFEFLSPAREGDVLAVPTIEWGEVRGASTYNVGIFRGNTQLASGTTSATTWTPPSRLDVTKDDVLHVRISAVDHNSVRTTLQYSPVFRVDHAAAPPQFLAPGEPAPVEASVRAPQLSWGAVSGATHYRLEVRNTANDAWFVDSHGPLTNTSWQYPTATDTSEKFSTPGVYEWYVVAYGAGGVVLHDGWENDQVSTFTIAGLDVVEGERVAVSGTALDQGNVCAKDLGTHRTDWCDGLPTTPVLDWSPVAEATHYRVWVSRDSDFTSGVIYGEGNTTANTRWIPTTALPDSEAGSAYYWFVQPCFKQVCGASPANSVEPSRHAFRKTSPKVKLGAPSAGAVVDTRQVTFTWEDYLSTNLSHEHAHQNSASAVPAPTVPSPEFSDQAAKQYEIQVSQSPDFRSLVDSATVDQTTYTSPGKIYPEGDLHWRVQAIDGQGNKLGWATAVRTFTKKSPSARGLFPRAGAEHRSSVAPLEWDHLPYSQGYNLQIAALKTADISPVADNNFNDATIKVRASNLKRTRYTGTGGTVVPVSAAGETYLWRVQQVMAGGNLGPWSAPETFVVRPDVPTLRSPAPSASVGPRAVVLRWVGVESAAQHRVTVRPTGTTSSTSVTTKASAWAVPTALKASTEHEWQVEALDANNRVVGASSWSPFRVSGPPAVVTAPRITGDLVLGGRLDVVAPVWDVADVANTYEWRRGNRVVTGVTGPQYTVATEDVGASITVVVTGTSPSAGVTTVTTAAIKPSPGPGPIVVSAPKLPNKVVVGKETSATPAVWAEETLIQTWQWLRDGVAIHRATSETYTPTRDDLGTLLSVQVTGTLPGRLPTVSTSAPVGVWANASTPPTKLPTAGNGSSGGSKPPSAAKKKTTTTVAAVKKIKLKGKKTAKAKITVTVRTTDGKAAKGKVILKTKGKKIGTGTLKANGKVKITTKALKRGTHKVTAHYTGNTTTHASTSKTVKVKIVK